MVSLSPELPCVLLTQGDAHESHPLRSSLVSLSPELPCVLLTRGDAYESHVLRFSLVSGSGDMLTNQSRHLPEIAVE
ncbi:MAG: hypothetical protein AAGF24_13825 [Cyanobacteria bacterium P01_H01_bin.121]